MRKIDMHHHLVEEVGYVDSLLREMDRLKIEKTALIGLGKLFPNLFVHGEHDGSVADDDAVERVVRAHPDRFFGLGFIRLGVDGADKVDELASRGFKGLKFHIPRKRYDDEEYFPVYERAQALGLPCLFHTGVVWLPTPRPEERISSFNMDPIHIEGIAQLFPDLPLIIAHLGVQSHLTALTLVRILPNIYADMSGTTPGWRANLTMEDWKRLLWFPHASEKLLFGTDVHVAEIAENIGIYEQICDAAEWDAPQRLNLFHGNAARLFNLA